MPLPTPLPLGTGCCADATPSEGWGVVLMPPTLGMGCCVLNKKPTNMYKIIAQIINDEITTFEVRVMNVAVKDMDVEVESWM